MKRPQLAAASLALLLAGCVAPREPVAVAPLDAPSLGLSGAAAPTIADDWWKAFGDPQLDRIVADALAGSPTLDAALARVRSAQAVLGGAEATRRPQITADAGEQVQRLSGAYTIPPPYGGSTRWIGQAQANLGWTLDFWGRQADAVRQARAEAGAAALDVDAARLALAGAVAQAYVELVRAERQIAVAGATLDQRDQAVRLARLRVKSQLASQIDVRAAETLLAEARQALVRAQGQRETIIHALAALAGRGADYYATIAPTSLKLAATPPLPDALPADLLARRPDILGAQARIDAAMAGRQVARKAFYPNVNLLGLAGLQAVGIGNLLTGDAVTYGAGAAIHLPIFAGGKLRADYAGATARVDAAIADYNQAVLGAVRETADAITRVHSLDADLAAQRQAAAGLADLRRLDTVRMATGLGSRLELIGSDVRLLAAEQETANLEADRTIAHIRLLVALGGGFDPVARPRSPAEARTHP